MTAFKERLRRGIGAAAVWLGKALIRLGFRPQVRFVSPAAEEAFRRGGCVIAVNHASLLDMPAAVTALGKRTVPVMAQDMLDRHASLRVLLYGFPLIPVDREHASLGWLRQSRKALREGKIVLIAPEGRINRARAVRPFKPGCVMLACAAGADILPAYQDAEFHWLFGRRWRMLVGEPVSPEPPPEGMEETALTRQAEALRDAVRALERQLTGQVRTDGADQ